MESNPNNSYFVRQPFYPQRVGIAQPLQNVHDSFTPNRIKTHFTKIMKTNFET